ncbi:MAG: lactonase family protein [Phycisphaerales bacterium]|jgi:6-phosphogluconolactonase|nr:lactonase family protein [Phycisphaerales bacterium]
MTTTAKRWMTLLTVMGACLIGCAPAESASKNLSVYIGTYTRKGSKGVYLSKLNLASGALSKPTLAAETDNPSFLSIHPSGKFLYASGGATKIDGKHSGLITAFAIDKTSGKLTQLNRQPSGGRGPCYVTVDATGRCALTANYSSGSVASLAIGSDGKLRRPTSIVQHVGSSANKQRQKGPHAHSINLDPTNRFALAADLGADKLLVYKFDPSTATIKVNTPASISMKPGAGPRHFSFGPTGQFVYAINELDSTITTLTFNPKNGTLAKLQTVSTLPPDCKTANTTAEVQVHPSGKFLYGSNRGHDSIAIFSIDAKSRILKPIGHHSSGGKRPRNFRIDPTGKFLLAANQDSNNVVVFAIDQATGKLKPTGASITVSSPVCVKFHAPAL